MSVPAASHYLLVQHGDVLTGRRMAAEIADALGAHIAPGDALLLNFAGVRVASLPFVDELVHRLQEQMASCPESMLVVHGLNASVREHVLTVLEQRDLVLAVLSRRGITLLGASGDLRKLMRVVQKLDLEFSEEELERRLPRERELVRSGLHRLLAAGALGGRHNRRLCRPPSERLLQLAR